MQTSSKPGANQDSQMEAMLLRSVTWQASVLFFSFLVSLKIVVVTVWLS